MHSLTFQITNACVTGEKAEAAAKFFGGAEEWQDRWLAGEAGGHEGE